MVIYSTEMPPKSHDLRHLYNNTLRSKLMIQKVHDYPDKNQLINILWCKKINDLCHFFERKYQFMKSYMSCRVDEICGSLTQLWLIVTNICN